MTDTAQSKILAKAPVSGPRPRGAFSRWSGRLVALASVVMFGWGSLLLAGWLKDRERTTTTLGTDAEIVRREAPHDARMDDYLDAAVAWSPVRPMVYGKDTALFASGHTREDPGAVFARILTHWTPDRSPEAIQAAIRMGPSAQAALRLNASVGMMPECMFLLRLPPDLTALRRDGKLKLEPGGIMLAFRGEASWDLVTFYFPKGLDLEHLAEEFEAPPDALRSLGPVAMRTLDPRAMIRSGRGPGSGGATVLCRSRGPAGAAVEEIAKSLESRGWRGESATEKDGGDEKFVVMSGPDQSVWIETSDRHTEGGLVTVMLGAP